MENYSFFVYVFCIMVFILIGKLFVIPIKKIAKLIANSILGAILIYIINVIGANYSFHIGLNWWTILCSGFLGIPGVILIIIIKLVL